MTIDASFRHLIKVFSNIPLGTLRGLDELYRALKFDQLDDSNPEDESTRICRQLLQELPLDQRAFDDIYAPRSTFKDFVPRLGEWCLSYRAVRGPSRKKYGELYGFICVMFITLRSLEESERKRNEARLGAASVPLDRKLPSSETCKILLQDRAVQFAIRRLYRARSAYSIRKDSVKTGGEKDWEELDFESLAFHRHGTTSIIVRIQDVNQQVRALKLILFPFFRFPAIERETRDYGLHYNPSALRARADGRASRNGGATRASAQAGKTLTTSNAPGVVKVIASSTRWILMEFIEGITLAELLAQPDLVDAKIQSLNKDGSYSQSFSELLVRKLESYSDSELGRAGVTREDLQSLQLDSLLSASLVMTDVASTKGVGDGIADATSKVAWRWMFDLGSALFDAMSGLGALAEGRPSPESGSDDLLFVHGDLTPSNIIVNDSRDLSFTLVDLGRNYLYSQSITGRGSADSGFVPPEIREGGLVNSLSDVYSVGQVLQFIGYRGVVPEQTVFDGFYDRTSLVARFLEDLIQEVSDDRLRIFSAARPDKGVNEDGHQLVKYQELKRIHSEEVYAVMTADRDGHGLAGDDIREVLKDLLHPWSRAWGRQRTLWRLRKGQDVYPAKGRLSLLRRGRREDYDLRRLLISPQGGSSSAGERGAFDRYTRSLVWWSGLATLAGALTLGLVITWSLRDAGWSWQIRPVEVGQKIAHSGGEYIPFIDSLRSSGYKIPDFRDNWAARLVGFSYVLAGAKYYQGLFSGLMPLLGRRPGRSGWRAVGAEIFMRSETLAAPILVSTTIFFQARFWPIASAIGQTIVVACNWTTWSFAAQSLRLARVEGISTAGAPERRILGLESYWEWVPSSLFYACVVWFIGLLIYFDVLHDIAVYAVAVASTNLFLFYAVKCGKGGRDVRIGLARGCIAAERVRIKTDRASARPGHSVNPSRSTVKWPPAAPIGTADRRLSPLSPWPSLSTEPGWPAGALTGSGGWSTRLAGPRSSGLDRISPRYMPRCVPGASGRDMAWVRREHEADRWVAATALWAP